MKRLILVLFVSLLAVSSSFSHKKILDEESVEYYDETPESGEHLRLIYNSVSRNLTVVYTLSDDFYFEGDAFVLIRDRIIKFKLDKGFKYYKTISEDIIKWHNDQVEYTRFLILY